MQQTDIPALVAARIDRSGRLAAQSEQPGSGISAQATISSWPLEKDRRARCGCNPS